MGRRKLKKWVIPTAVILVIALIAGGIGIASLFGNSDTPPEVPGTTQNQQESTTPKPGNDNDNVTTVSYTHLTLPTMAVV